MRVVLLSVFPFGFLRSLDGRANQKALSRGNILEDNHAVRVWVQVLFHVGALYKISVGWATIGQHLPSLPKYQYLFGTLPRIP